MKVLLVNGSPHEQGTTSVAIHEVERELNANGIETEIFWIGNKPISGCIGCYACHKTGKCIHSDGMNELGQKLLNADVIVFATPVYFYSMSGQLKVFIDRLVPYYTKITADTYLIATQWDSNKEIMENTFNAIRGCTIECFENCTEKGVIYGVGLDGIGEAKKHSEYMSKAYEMGKNI